MPRAKTQEAAAKEIGCSVTSLKKWRKEPWWQESFWVRGEGYDCDSIRAANPHQPQEESRRTFDAQHRKMASASKALELQLKKIQLDERVGVLVPIADILEVVAHHERMLIDSMLELPKKLGRLIPDKKLRGKLVREGDSVVRVHLRHHGKAVESELQKISRRRKS